jgi:four helix bundle protein
MNKDDLKDRTKKFSIAIIHLIELIPRIKSGNTISNQIIRSGTSIGANYRAACRAKSDKDFLNKIIIVEEEADETLFWLELLIDSKMMKKDQLEPLIKECNELVAIFTASGRTVRNRLEAMKKEKLNG